VIYNGVTYVPLRSVSSGLDKNTVYDGKSKTVKINDKQKMYTKYDLENKKYETQTFHTDYGSLYELYEHYEMVHEEMKRAEILLEAQMLAIANNDSAAIAKYDGLINEAMTKLQTDIDLLKQNPLLFKLVFGYYGGTPSDIDVISGDLISAHTHLMAPKQDLDSYKSTKTSTYKNLMADDLTKMKTSYTKAFNLYKVYKDDIFLILSNDDASETAEDEDERLKKIKVDDIRP